MPQRINSRQSSSSDYTTSEQLTGAKWIDGKSIYKKTVALTGTLPSGFTNIPHGSTNIETMVNIEGGVISGGLWFPFGWFGGANGEVMGRFTSTDIVMYLGSNRANSSSFNATIYYTKTTG